MVRIEVQVAQDHLETLVTNPISGLAELIWNSLDADADRVNVELTRNEAGGIDTVAVLDDGTGMGPERIAIDFARLGQSWKAMRSTTEGGRELHGKSGQGRFTAFALGEAVHWLSVGESVDKGKVETRVVGRRSSLRDFDVSDPVATDQPTRTLVEIHQLSPSASSLLADTESVTASLTAKLALYLEKYPVEVIFDETKLSPAALQTHRHSAALEVDGATIQLEVIEWNTNVSRALYFCDSNGVALHEMPPGIHAPGYQFTAYLRWEGFKDLGSNLQLGDLAPPPLPVIIEAARDELRDYFKRRANEHGTELLDAWKADDSYPFAGEPVGVIETVKRDLFDIVAVAAAPAVEATDAKSRKFSLRLLREAIESDPTTLQRVLRDVLDLPQDRLAELGELLKKTSLTSMIAATKLVTDRLDFIDGLEVLLNERTYKKHFLERSQLQHILASETWLFREEYALTADDNTLATALRDHIEILGRTDLCEEEVEPITDEDEREVVVDLMLSRVIEQAENRRNHLVVELKRPSKHIGTDEISQIQNYATTVSNSPYFDTQRTSWDFWIVGDQLKPAAQSMANQTGREPGIIVQSDEGRFTVRAVTWATILQDARHRLRFVRKALDYSNDGQRGLEHVKEVHGRYVPDLSKLTDGNSTG